MAIGAATGPAIGKRAAARAAIGEVQGGMLIGLGTGTTVAFAIDALAARARQGLRVTTVATSLATARAAAAQGLIVLDFARISRVDLAIDGADEIDPLFRAIKGGGGAMLREKIVAAAADRMIAIVDETKQVDRLGARPLPVEVLPFATAFAMRAIEPLGARVVARRAGGRIFATDQGNVILDCRFKAIERPHELAAALSAIPGVLGHGLFLEEIDIVYVGYGEHVSRRERGAGALGGQD